MANTQQIGKNLQAFDFEELFIELGWSRSSDRLTRPFINVGQSYERRQIANLSGVAVFEIFAPNGEIPDRLTRRSIHAEISKIAHENVLIFLDANRTQSVWLWVKREKGKTEVREHDYFKGQPVDLMLSKLIRINFEIEDFDDEGNPPPIVEVARRLQSSLDVEKTVKKFYTEFERAHVSFLEHIRGIGNERDKQWYASVILNRLMFIYFLQKKLYVDGDDQYLQNKLEDSQAKGANLYFREFLWKLFFVGFAKPVEQRKESEKLILGDVPYLNGGLFLPHRLENAYQIQIDDEAFENVFALFERYSWNLDDTPGGKADEMNPDVLGYIFEKYINNQKSAGAYYTRPEITQYLCEQTIYKLILDRINSLAEPANNQQLGLYSSNADKLFLQRTYDSMADLLLHLDSYLCEKLWFHILPSLKILDPACGSGAFLVAALKTLLNVYSAVIGKMETLGDKRLKEELERIRSEHKSLNYDIKKRIITNNIFGVDLMEESTEIAKLRLFMTLVSSVHSKSELEPLPNIDFNILAGNSLIGILKVNVENFEKAVTGKKPTLFDAELAHSYKEILADKNRSIELYKNHTFKAGEDSGLDQDQRLLHLREHIEKIRCDSYAKLNHLLLGDFNDLKIKFEQATWDAARQKEGKPEKRDLKTEDIENLHPFHWGYEFDEILNKKGGFDAIITNPPWETFKPQAKEFFADYSNIVTKNKMTIKEFETKKNELLRDKEIKSAWLEYQSRFPFLSLFYRNAKQFENQISVVNGKKAGTDINLYKLFLEQCFNLLNENGECGIVIPSGIYTDLGAKQLREMLFNQTEITGLFGFENRKIIFEGVDSRFKFVVLTFRKGGHTIKFPSAFMRHETRELESFPRVGALPISIKAIKKLSPDSLSIMEFKNETDVQIAEKMFEFPLLGEHIENKWNLVLSNEFHMTGDSHLFKTSKITGRLPLYEGKIIHQFTHLWGEPKYWIDESEARGILLNSRIKNVKQVAKINNLDWEDVENQKIQLDYENYRFAFRDVAASTNERTMIMTVLPPKVFCPHTMTLEQVFSVEVEGRKINPNVRQMNSRERLFICALMNSFVLDSCLRRSITNHLSFFFIYGLPFPRLTESDKAFAPIVSRAAKLICTTEEFDDLAKEVRLGSYKNGATDELKRQKIRAELDALVAHLYGLTEEEFAYILTTFPLVSDVVKVATQNAFRDAERGLIK